MSTPVAVAAFLFAAGARASSPSQEDPSSGAMHRLSEAQYRNTIADIFGEDIDVPGRVRGGAVRKDDLDEYERMARAIAAQVVDDRHRQGLVSCVPRNTTLPDDACTAAFFRSIGRFVFRRPLSLTEVQQQVAAARAATDITRDFYAGLGVSLATMLVSPKFLFDIDAVESDRATPGTMRLDAYSRASRLSLFLWNASPDAPLLEAAERGDLQTATGAARQVDRLLASPRSRGTVAALLSDATSGAAGCALPELVVLERAVQHGQPVPPCLARTIAESAIRRPLRAGEADWMAGVTARFVKGGYGLPGLLREIATSEAFLHVAPAEGAR